MDKFKRGDRLTTTGTFPAKEVAKVEEVEESGVVHCVNTLESATMKVGSKFQFTPNGRTRYVLFEE